MKARRRERKTPPRFRRLFSNLLEQLQRGELSDASWKLIIQVALPAVGALALLIVAYFVAKYAARIVSNVLCRRVDQTLGKFGGKFTFYSLMAMSGIAICQTIGFDVTGFAAVLAAAGFAIGLAFQGTLSNFAAGILLLVFRPFQVGDVVNTAGVTGKVNAVDLFTTTFDTPDNRRLIVPNSSITGATIENISFHKERRVEVLVGVDYTASLDTTRDVLTACAESLAEETIQGEDRGYQIILGQTGAPARSTGKSVYGRSRNASSRYKNCLPIRSRDSSTSKASEFPSRNSNCILTNRRARLTP